MKTIHLSQPITTTTNGVADDKILPLTNQHITGTAIQHQQILKTITDVLGEGLKQNFLGPNIDMEFLTLTVRSYASTSTKAIKHFAKGLNVKQFFNTGHQLNQPSY